MYQLLVIAGNLGGDPEMRFTPSGQAVTNFSVATNRTYTPANGEQVKETTWFRVSCWGRTAEVTNEYLKKGSPVLIEGRLVPDPATGGPRVWTGQDGQARASFEINASSVKFLGRGNGGGEAQADPEPVDDDIPF